MFRKLWKKKPWHNWGVIYQQGYMARLKEFNSSNGDQRASNNGGSSDRCKSGKKMSAGSSTGGNIVMGKAVITNTGVQFVTGWVIVR